MIEFNGNSNRAHFIVMSIVLVVVDTNYLIDYYKLGADHYPRFYVILICVFNIIYFIISILRRLSKLKKDVFESDDNSDNI